MPGKRAPTVPELGEFLLKMGIAKYKLPERIETIDAFPAHQGGQGGQGEDARHDRREDRGRDNPEPGCLTSRPLSSSGDTMNAEPMRPINVNSKLLAVTARAAVSIDVHHHFNPTLKDNEGNPWSVQMALDEMDQKRSFDRYRIARPVNDVGSKDRPGRVRELERMGRPNLSGSSRPLRPVRVTAAAARRSGARRDRPCIRRASCRWDRHVDQRGRYLVE